MAFSFYDCKTPISSFVDWILGSFNSEYEIYVYSHYGGRFDEHFVLRELYVRGFSPSIIMTGNKLYEIRIKARRDLAKLIFRDSYMIVNSPLAALPATFDLKCENKLYFPHLFNKNANKDVILPCLPPKDDYLPRAKKAKDLENFEKWYEENKNTPFSLRQQLKEYDSYLIENL